MSSGLLVAYCHRFDILMQTSRIYFLACTIGKTPSTFLFINAVYDTMTDVLQRPVFTFHRHCVVMFRLNRAIWSEICLCLGYGIGLLITFVALALMQMGQPALLYLVPCTLLTSLAVALWRRELPLFWTGSGFVVNTSLIWVPSSVGTVLGLCTVTRLTVE